MDMMTKPLATLQKYLSKRLEKFAEITNKQKFYQVGRKLRKAVFSANIFLYPNIWNTGGT